MSISAYNSSASHANDTASGAIAQPLAEKVPCGECKGSGGTSVFAAINHGEHACTDCNGKGFNWEPIDEPPATV